MLRKLKLLKFQGNIFLLTIFLIGTVSGIGLKSIPNIANSIKPKFLSFESILHLSKPQRLIKANKEAKNNSLVLKPSSSPSLSPTPIPTPMVTPKPIYVTIPAAKSDNSQLIDCTGPDGKHLQVTQTACDNFNKAWVTPNPQPSVVYVLVPRAAPLYAPAPVTYQPTFPRHCTSYDIGMFTNTDCY